MEHKKIIKNLFLALICLLALALIGINIFQHRQIKRAGQRMSNETSSDNKAPEDNTLEKGHTPSIIANQNPAAVNEEKAPEYDYADELKYQLEAAEEELDMVKKQMADEEAKKAEQARIQEELSKKVREDPANKKRLREMRRTSLDSSLALLFKELNLSPEDLEKLKEIMLDEEEASVTSRIVSQSGNMVVAVSESVDPGDEYQNKIRELLGAQDYEKYQNFKERRVEAHNVTAFNGTLSSDDALTEDQQWALIDALYETREKIISEQGNEGDNGFSITEMTEESITEEIKRRERIHEGYIEAATGTLSESQLEKLNAYYKQQRDEQESSMRMMSQMSLIQATKTDDENE